MKIKEQIVARIKEAQKSKDAFRLSALRMIKSALDYKALELKVTELEDPDEIRILQQIAKQRKESIEAFKKANREESAKKEEEELKIVESFLPPALSHEEIERRIDETIAELGEVTMKDMGRVMKACMEKFKGEPVDGRFMSDTVKSKLNK